MTEIESAAENWATYNPAAVQRVLDSSEDGLATTDVGDLYAALESAAAIYQRVVGMLGPDHIQAVSDIENFSCMALITDDVARLLTRLADIAQAKPNIFARPQIVAARPWMSEYDVDLMSGLRRATQEEAGQFAARTADALRRHGEDITTANRSSRDFPFGNFRQPNAPLRRPTLLYRWYDQDDNLLYIGITENAAARFDSHSKRSSWAAFAAYPTVQRFQDRPYAESAEVRAIKEEAPLFNHQHNDTREARDRLVAYLVDKGRLDLLAPSVSRG